MRKHTPALLLAFCSAIGSGCSICSPGFLDDYAAVGGKWQRSDPTTGRVGSILSDPGSTVASPVHDGAVAYDGGYVSGGYADGSYDAVISPDTMSGPNKDGSAYDGTANSMQFGDATVDGYSESVPAPIISEPHRSDSSIIEESNDIIILGEEW